MAPAKQAAAAEAGTATIYYYTPYKNWSTVNIHHNGSGGWTAVPGVPMEAACANWTSKTVNIAAGGTFQTVFNNGSGSWDNNGGNNYSVGLGIHQVKNGQVLANSGNPCANPDPVNTATVFYKPNANWTNVNIHYAPVGAAWTTSPGIAMEPACVGWKKKTLSLGTANGLAATFNNGSSWDNNNGQNYTLGIGISKVENGVVSSGDPCGGGVLDTIAPSVPAGLTQGSVTSASVTFSWTASVDNAGGSGIAGYDIYRNGALIKSDVAVTTYTDTGLMGSTSYNYTVLAKDAAGNKSAQSSALTVLTSAGNQAQIYYYAKTRGWSTVNIHYAINGSGWTTPPGVQMNENACTDWTKKTIELGSATSLKAAFNNGSAWDNNGGADYNLGSGIITVKDGVVTPGSANPCTPLPTDEVAPSVPINVTAVANHLTVTLSWDASTDNAGGRGVAGYEITRTGGTQGSKVMTTTTNSLYDTNLEAQTSYAYTVKAYDKATPSNLSAASAAVTATTGDAPIPNPGGTPLGTDMREDSIYFVMTARFYDGDSSNNRGGQLHVKSGNAANNDPMYRGDFKGLMDKLDYIKALGFSAIWITPVVLNRSDYDFHGYHGYDFYRVDPRLESPGATYQDLINAAHNKGIKIIQDVVYNHSSRWGAKGLFTPKVFGIQDNDWSWYYDDPIPGLEYDGLYPASVSGKAYNGDIWSTVEPEDNTCRNWGVFMNYNPEGRKVYNCQWPNPTSGMFPSQYYHQCWIGNWEGEDSRSCWLHEDLADFNTESKPVQDYLIDAYNKFIDMGVDGFRIDTAVHIPRVIWNRRFLPAAMEHSEATFGEKGKNFFMFGEVGSFVNDKWNRGSVNHSAQFFTWKERQTYSSDDAVAALEQYNYENNLGTGNQPTSTNAFLNGNNYHSPDRSQFSGMNVIDMRMHMNFGDANNAFWNGKDSDDSYNDATYNVVYVDSHDFGPNKSKNAYAGGTDAWAENMSLMWTFRGIPTLYMGSEIEFQAGKEIDCGPNCPLASTRRAYFGDKIEGTVVASSFGKADSANGTVAQTLNYPLVKHVQRLNQIRRKIPALQKGQYSTDGISGQMAYKRRYTDAAKGIDSFALITVSGSATFTGIPNGTYKDAITGGVITVSNGTLTATVSGKGNLRVYVLDLPGNPAPGKIGEDGTYLK
ncbi:carbohydrate binding domain-containing protein [Cohnella cholangitidis]|uniref:carbohydrate binding domain-containing protein n=1 Tax=Cohnella cholangitidis TaxID=2598458 RepID=UPI001E592094|nr:carbohydrate binding domain-containing protein [Cohnella cholangitidis]